MRINNISLKNLDVDISNGTFKSSSFRKRLDSGSLLETLYLLDHIHPSYCEGLLWKT